MTPTPPLRHPRCASFNLTCIPPFALIATPQSKSHSSPGAQSQRDRSAPRVARYTRLLFHMTLERNLHHDHFTKHELGSYSMVDGTVGDHSGSPKRPCYSSILYSSYCPVHQIVETLLFESCDVGCIAARLAISTARSEVSVMASGNTEYAGGGSLSVSE